MISEWAIYDTTTGLILGHVTADGVQLVGNVPAGSAAIAGNFDALSQRVDISIGKVIDYQPPQPSPDHEWNAEAKRWRLSAAAQAALDAATAAQVDIDAANLASVPLLRAAILDGDAVALNKLRELHDSVQNASALISANKVSKEKS